MASKITLLSVLMVGFLMESSSQAEEVENLNSQSNATDQEGSLPVTTTDFNLCFFPDNKIDKDTTITFTTAQRKENSYTDALQLLFLS